MSTEDVVNANKKFHELINDSKNFGRSIHITYRSSILIVYINEYTINIIGKTKVYDVSKNTSFLKLDGDGYVCIYTENELVRCMHVRGLSPSIMFDLR